MKSEESLELGLFFAFQLWDFSIALTAHGVSRPFLKITCNRYFRFVLLCALSVTN